MKLKFETVGRRDRAGDLIPTIRRCSKLFKQQHQNDDIEGKRGSSREAWDAMTQLFEILRNEQDQSRLASSYMDVNTAFIVNDVTPYEQGHMVATARIDKTHAGYGPLSLRNTLNKIAHHNTASVNFRIDGRGAHYLVLGGRQRNTPWVAEVLVSRLCTNAEAAIKAIHI